MARREERAYREYVSDEQRSQPGCPARELCDESLLRDTSAQRAASALRGLSGSICSTAADRQRLRRLDARDVGRGGDPPGTATAAGGSAPAKRFPDTRAPCLAGTDRRSAGCGMRAAAAAAEAPATTA